MHNNPAPSQTHPPPHSFLKEQTEPPALIADFLSVQERLAFLQTHKYVPCMDFCLLYLFWLYKLAF